MRDGGETITGKQQLLDLDNEERTLRLYESIVPLLVEDFRLKLDIWNDHLSLFEKQQDRD
jgi:hypothetical protein